MQRPSSPAAESRSGAEERGEAQAVGGRVQRLVVWLFETLASMFGAIVSRYNIRVSNNEDVRGVKWKKR